MSDAKKLYSLRDKHAGIDPQGRPAKKKKKSAVVRRAKAKVTSKVKAK